MVEISYEDLDDLILLKIFTYLPSRSLIRSMRVCKKWNRLINEEIMSRKSYPESIFYKSESWSSNNLIERSNFTEEFDIQLEKLRSSPSLALFFLNRPSNVNCFVNIDEENKESTYHRSKRLKVSRKKSRLSSLIKTFLNENVNKLFIYGDGIVSSKQGEGIEIESDFEFPAFSGLFLPKSNSYRFVSKSFYQKTTLPELKTIEELNGFLGVQSDEELKYFLILIDGFSDSKLIPFLNKINELRKTINLRKSFTCSGGIVKQIDNNTGQRPKLVFLSLIAKNDSNVKVAQIIIKESTSHDFKSIWDEKMSLLKNTGVYNPKNLNSLAFQVSCCGRGKEYHSVDNLESNLFLKAFPNIPLIGFFGYGEIGADFLPDYSTNNNNKDYLGDLKVRDSVSQDITVTGFASIFTIISLDT